MKSLSTEEHKRLSRAIQSLERDTHGELVVVVAKASDTYRFIPTLWAALVALALPGVYLLWQWLTLGGWQNPESDQSELISVYLAQVTLFFGLMLLFQWTPIQRAIVPSTILKQRASGFAREQFLHQRLHHTNKRCGVMVFISLLERHVEIIVDKGLAEQVDDSHWESTIADMIPHLKNDQPAKACELAIHAVASTMQQHALRDASSPKPNELPDHVVEL